MKKEEIIDKLGVVFNLLQHRDELEIAELVEEVIKSLQSNSVTDEQPKESVEYCSEEDDYFIDSDDGRMYLEPSEVLERINAQSKQPN